MSRSPAGDPDRSTSDSPDWAALADMQAARSERRRWFVLGALLALLPLLAAIGIGIIYSSESGGPPPRDPPAGRDPQQEYVEQLDDARKQLFQAWLAYSDARKFELTEGETAEFRATVIGGWQLSPKADGTSRPGTEVRGGAEIEVRLHCSGGGVTCPALSSPRQSVLTETDSADWAWQVTPKKSGTVSLRLTMTAYYLDTDTVLFEKSVKAGSVEVAEPDVDSGPSSWPGRIFGWAQALITIAGALAGSLGAVVALVVAVRSLRRHGSGHGGSADGA